MLSHKKFKFKLTSVQNFIIIQIGWGSAILIFCIVPFFIFQEFFEFGSNIIYLVLRGINLGAAGIYGDAVGIMEEEVKVLPAVSMDAMPFDYVIYSLD